MPKPIPVIALLGLTLFATDFAEARDRGRRGRCDDDHRRRSYSSARYDRDSRPYRDRDYDRDWRRNDRRSVGESIAIVGGSAGAGAGIGAIAAGAKGAALGAAIGGTAGFIYDRTTRNRDRDRRW